MLRTRMMLAVCLSVGILPSRLAADLFAVRDVAVPIRGAEVLVKAGLQPNYRAVSFQAKDFVRGDANRDGVVNGQTSDAIFIVNWLFMGSPPPLRMDSADANDDNVVDMTDAIDRLTYDFQGGDAPPPPFPSCGRDGSADRLGRNIFAPCP